MAETPTFQFTLDDDLAGRTLVAIAGPGMAGAMAADSLVTETDADQVGHATVEGVPTVTPFTDGRPRHPTRVYRVPDGPTVVLCEALLSQGVADRLADAVLDIAGQTVRELTTLYGVPYPHGPDGHAVFSVATDDYPAEPLSDAVAGPLSGGFLDGLAGRLLARGMAADERAAAALVTPTHPPAADFEAAVRLLEALGRLYDLPVEAATLRERSAQIQEHYQELADRMAEAGDDETDPFVDRMYM